MCRVSLIIIPVDAQMAQGSTAGVVADGVGAPLPARPAAGSCSNSVSTALILYAYFCTYMLFRCVLIQ